MFNSNISSWCVDEFLNFITPRSTIVTWSSEQMSRLSSFVDAYVLFDKVHIPFRYSTNTKIQRLDPDSTIFSFIQPETLRNSDDMSKGISFDLSLNARKFEDLIVDDYKWYSQHVGYAPPEDYQSLMAGAGISFTHLRLWQTSLSNEVSEVTDSTAVLPLSLQNIEVLETQRTLQHILRLNDLNNQFQSNMRAVSAVCGEIFHDFISNTPPFLSLLIDKSTTQDRAIDVLIKLRKEYTPLKEQSKKFKNLLQKETTISRKRQVIQEWDDSWSNLVKSSFQRTSLLSRKVSSADFSKSIFNPLGEGLPRILQEFLDRFGEHSKNKRFQFYCDLYNELEGVTNAPLKLQKRFMLDLSNTLVG